MAGYRNRQGAKPKASTVMERRRKSNRKPSTLKGIPHPPAHLTEVAKAEWRRLSRILNDAGLLETPDKTALAALCSAYARWVEAEEKIQKLGLVVKVGKNEYPIPNPFLAIAQKERKEMVQLLGEFGMTPASRSRIPGKSESPGKPKRIRTKAYALDPRDLLEAKN